MRKDSVGNPLPDNIYLSHGATPIEYSRALAMSSFNLAIDFAMEAGKTVVYNATEKSATIFNDDGMTSIIQHL